MDKTLRIGTRDSKLAMWQANKVCQLLENLGYKTQIVAIKSTGDLVLDKPLYTMGITGIFTRSLDIAMLNGEIDIAVHSMKDVPTFLPEQIRQIAVLERENFQDILVLKNDANFLQSQEATIATGSLRRKAQWLHRYPTHQVKDLRGNVQTRLKKLAEEDYDAAIFAAAGLERIGMRPKNTLDLSWMIPAPAQGVIMLTGLKTDEFSINAAAKINHFATQICTQVERDFLQFLEGGCTAPIGALAKIDEEKNSIILTGVLLSRDGKQKIEVSKSAKIGEHENLAREAADYVIAQGGKKIIADDEILAQTASNAKNSTTNLTINSAINFATEKTESKKVKVFSTKKLTLAQQEIFQPNLKIDAQDFIQVYFNQLDAKLIAQKIPHVIITSKNGVKALLHNFTAEELKAKFENIYCVGEETKKLLQQTFGKVTHSEENAKNLANYLAKTLQEGDEVSYFCSSLRLDTLANILKAHKIKLNEITAYKTQLIPNKLNYTPDAIIFYSPSTVTSFIQENSTQAVAFCIGETTAQEAKKHFKQVFVAENATVTSLINLVNTHFTELKK